MNETPNKAIGESWGCCHECGRRYVRTMFDRYSALCFNCAPADRVYADGRPAPCSPLDAGAL